MSFTMEALFLKLLLFLTIGLVDGSSKPLMFISGPRIGVEFSKLQLKCLTSAEDKHLLWYFSSNGSDEHYESLRPSSMVRLESNGRALIFRLLDKTHVGTYRCCSSVMRCAKANLYVLSATDNHSLLKPTDNTAVNSGILDVPSHGTFSLAIYHASFNGEAYIDHERTVSFCDHFLKRGRECYQNRSSNMVSYNVQNGTMEDSAQFAVKVIFNQQLELLHLHILIRGSPTIQMNNFSILTNSTYINLQCRGHAYPSPIVTFSYIPCDPLKMDHLRGLSRGKHCEASMSLPQHLGRHSPFNHTTIFEVIVPSWPITKGPGIVTCEASNSEGTTVAEAFLYVRNFLNPMSFTIDYPTDVVLYEETVHVTCQVDVYNFTNQFTIQYGGNTFNLTGERIHYAWAVTYQAYISNASQNQISCLAYHTNGTLLVNTLNLLIRYPSKPHVISINDTVNTTIAFGDHLRLECDIDGTPTPNVVWFKNDDHLSTQQGHFIRVSLLDETKATYKCLGSNRLGKASKTWNIVVEDTMKWLLISGLGAAVFIALLLIISVIWCVEAYKQLITRQNVLEEQLNSTDNA